MTGETLGGFSLYKVQRENISKNANLLVIPFPRNDADDTATFDFLGVTVTITIDGTVTGGDIATFISELLGGADLVGGVITGSQDTTVSYVGLNSVVVDVKVDSIVTTMTASDTDQILKYSIKLVMSS